MNPKAEIYWQQQLQAFHDLAAFDGLWIDMNEVSNFVSGSAANSGGPGGYRRKKKLTGCGGFLKGG